MAMGSKFKLLARAGYVARGAVFILVAGLALFSSFGGRPETKSALDALLSQPLGQLWLTLIGLGLLGFVAWRLAQSVANADNHENNAKGMAIRTTLFMSAMIYTGLAFYAFSRAWSLGYGGSGSGEKGLAAWAMAQPFGIYLAGGIGVGFLCGGVITIYKGLSRRFERYLSLSDRKTLLLLCIYGLVSRGIIFVIIGILFCYAAFTVDPGKAGSMADALSWIRRLPFGAIIYIVVGAGLASFGIYNFVEARYRIIRSPDTGAIRAKLPALS
ncbi:DUF1206 domain-containing protein [Rhizobium grahamii]|uniref:DUF1206 domain-containing protein n=1 Tax=Rhizobium grahamii TaxID=1120045 RepID=A0A370KFS8_9HYPH|nr:DUF1206 domain-containing protein [Rhizobium grahamii]RDJ03301.1 hypothetical protein B5K06_30365 [Rhizobium grahamii]